MPDPRPGLGCVKTLGGQVCKMGAPADPGSPALMTDQEHALADLNVGLRQERERVARRISAA